MGRIRIEASPRRSGKHAALMARLAAELKSDREGGQPRIEEFVFGPTRSINVTVFWDEWAKVRLEERMGVVIEAYAQAQGREAADRIVIASAFTFEEAFEIGLLPYQVAANWRSTDPVTREQCTEAIIAEGGSVFGDTPTPQLRFSTLEAAEAAKGRLTSALAVDRDFWAVLKDVTLIERD